MARNDINYFATRQENAEGKIVTTVKGYASDVSADKFFRDVSEILCFDDCYPVEVVEIIWHGRKVRYDGWRRQMCFGYSNEHGKQVWVGCFPEWDH